jgi:hypothetical protein
MFSRSINTAAWLRRFELRMDQPREEGNMEMPGDGIAAAILDAVKYERMSIIAGIEVYMRLYDQLHASCTTEEGRERNVGAIRALQQIRNDILERR